MVVKVIQTHAYMYLTKPYFTPQMSYAIIIPSADKDTQGFRSQTARHNCVVLI